MFGKWHPFVLQCKLSATIRTTTTDHPYYEIKLVINHKTKVFHVWFYQLNYLVKLLENAITPKFSIWMICSGTFDAQIPPGGKIPNTDIILGGGMFVLVLCGILVSGGHTKIFHAVVWPCLVTVWLWLQMKLHNSWTVSEVNGGFNMPGSLHLAER